LYDYHCARYQITWSLIVSCPAFSDLPKHFFFLVLYPIIFFGNIVHTIPPKIVFYQFISYKRVFFVCNLQCHNLISGIRLADHVTPSIRKSFHKTNPQAAVSRYSSLADSGHRVCSFSNQLVFIPLCQPTYSPSLLRAILVHMLLGL
jgi:hypothetical protein